MNEPSTYLLRTKVTDWVPEEFFSMYAKKHPNTSNAGLVPLMLNDLKELAMEKPTLADAIKSLQSILKIASRVNEFPTSEHTSGPATLQANTTWNSCDVVVYQGSHSKKRKQPNVNDKDSMSVKKGKKAYTSTPEPTPSVSTHKSRVSDEDRATLAPLYCIKINDNQLPDTPKAVVDTYEKNLEDQSVKMSLTKRPRAFNFLKQALNQSLAELRRFLWSDYGKTDKLHGLDDDDSKLIESIRLVLTDFTANCIKPDYRTKTNERTPIVESIVPIFKYLSSVQPSISFVSCEKGLVNPKTTKLMNGVGMASIDQKERVLIESSGLEDGSHTENTLKLLEYTSICLQGEKALYQQASYATFVKRRLFPIQFVGCKLTLLTTFIGEDNLWTCHWQRTATIPSRWEERMYWIQAFELIVNLMDLRNDQDHVTQKLIAEHNELISAAKEDTMRNYYRRHAFAPPFQQANDR